jgi:hypothetical protein
MKTRTYGERRFDRLFGIYNRPVEILAAVAVGMLAVHWMLVMWFVMSRLGTLRFLRLHYTATLGVDWIDSWWMIFAFPVFGLVVFVVNGLFSGALSAKFRSSALVLMSVTIFLEAVAAVGGVMAMLLNG